MKPFHTIAVPHRDIIEGKLTIDIFAANLWQVFKNEGPEEYRDADTFFKKSFTTKGLNNLLSVVEKRLTGKGGDSVIRLETPFGGGKTHSLITLYHKAKLDWKSNIFVFVGDSQSPSDVMIWEELERQLTGEIKELKGITVPSGDKIKTLIEKNKPVLLLIDELIEYLIPARGIKVGGSTLDSQILSFMKRLTEIVSQVGNCILVTTSPSRKQYSPEDQLLLTLLEERLGRIEKVFTPVEDNEISSVIRRRLFTKIDESSVNKVVNEVVDYFKEQNIIPVGIESSEYKSKFLDSYPFLPDVIECLYYRWGSYHTFQRTRGVLRLLSLVIHDLKDKDLEYITPANFSLNNSDLRRELIKHIGNEFDGVVASDILDRSSGTKYADNNIGDAFQGLNLGSKCSTTIFLYSFSGGIEKGAPISQIKRSSSNPGIPSSVISEVLDILEGKLFFIQKKIDNYLFTNKPNLNKILLTKMENVDERIVIELEKDYLKKSIKKIDLKGYVWPEKDYDIPDDTSLKVIVLRNFDSKSTRTILENKGQAPRIYRNTLFFLIRAEEKIANLGTVIRRKIAYEDINKEETLNLTDDEKKTIKDSIKTETDNIFDSIRDTYSIIQIPTKNGFKSLDLGIHTEGESINLLKSVLDRLRNDSIIIEKLGPNILNMKYLAGKDFVSTKAILENFMKTLEEPRIISNKVLQDSIAEGTKLGEFGLGNLLENNEIKVKYWQQSPKVYFDETEVIINKNKVSVLLQKIKDEETTTTNTETETIGAIDSGSKSEEQSSEEETSINVEESGKEEREELKEIVLDFTIPKGKSGDVFRIVNYLHTKFDDIKIKIVTSNGKISQEEYESKIKEALDQLGIK